jgi:hypothetical protein
MLAGDGLTTSRPQSKHTSGYPMGQPVTDPHYPLMLFLVFGLHRLERQLFNGSTKNTK